MRVALLYLLAASGCGFSLSSAMPPGDGGPGDGGDPPADIARDGCVTFSGHLDTCTAPAGTSLDLDGAYVFDTGTGMLLREGGGAPPVSFAVMTTTTNQVEVGVLVVDDLELRTGTQLRAIGTRGFAIVAMGAIRVNGTAIIDVGAGGAGSRLSCSGSPGVGENDNGGAAGGGGGGFGAAGGRGGNGDSDGGQTAGGAAGAPGAAALGPLGGCPGAAGGNGADPGGAGGQGGGAVYLVSADRIELVATAAIQAGGGGGGGGTKINSTYGDAGGGGGGSGGMILLEAPRVRTGILVANGGGGGEGSGNGGAGRVGNPGTTTTARALGGSGGSSTGSDGGPGGSAVTATGGAPPNVQAGGGGGGGGGVGIIRVVSPDQMVGTTSPPAS